MSDLIERQALIHIAEREAELMVEPIKTELPELVSWLARKLPSAESTRTALTEDDIQAIRIHLGAYKERMCNQGRWNEAKEYDDMIKRLLCEVNAGTVRRTGKWIKYKNKGIYQCSICGEMIDGQAKYRAAFCPACGSRMIEKGEEDE